MDGRSVSAWKPASRWLHPWLSEVRLTLPRHRDWSRIVLMVCVLLALLWWRPALYEPVLAVYRHWPWLPPLLGAVASYRLIRAHLHGLRRQWQHGWWAAIPISQGVQWRTLLLITVLLAVAIWLPMHTLLMQAWRLTPSSAAATALPLGAAITLGAAAAWLSVLRPRPLQHEVVLTQGRRDPLWSAQLLHDPKLPWLAEWQRRETTLRWRRGGSSLPLAFALCLFPSGAAPPALIGLLFFALTLGWLGQALRSSASVAVQATDLLRAVPISRGACLRSLSRYPTFCVLIAAPPTLLLAALALSRQGVLLWCVITLLLASPALVQSIPLLRTRTQT